MVDGPLPVPFNKTTGSSNAPRPETRRGYFRRRKEVSIA